MEIKLNFSNKAVYTVITLFLFLGLVIGVYAYTQSIPDPGHGADTILVNINGEEMTLQDALDNEMVGGSEWPDGNYCIIQAQDETCPNGFEAIDPSEANEDGTGAIYGDITSRFESTLRKRTKTSDGSYAVTTWAFCCKN